MRERDKDMAAREYEVLTDRAYDEMKALRDVPGEMDLTAEAVKEGRLEPKEGAATLVSILAAARGEADDAARIIAVTLANNGFSPQELADVLGVTRTTLYRWRREAAGKKGDAAPQHEELPIEGDTDS